jgi:hypothetical protein
MVIYPSHDLVRMIYLILTASLHNQVPSMVTEDRLTRYRYAITESLHHIPPGIQPIIVENTGHGALLEGFSCHGEPIPVVGTENGSLDMRNKGVNEWLDIQAVIERVGVQDNDIVVKLTGRYRLLTPRFLEEIERTKEERDAWFRFMNVCTGEETPCDCVLGCYGARVSLLRFLSWSWLNLFDSPEQAMARFIRSSVASSRLTSMDRLDVECVFSDTGRVLCV